MIMCRALLILLVVSSRIQDVSAVMCYWCSGVGEDRECETRPYAVQTGPVYLNCRANFCLSAKVIDAETGQVQSFARLCDNVPRGNLCIRDSKLLTCYESCTSDLCNSGNPSPLHLPTVSYAGEDVAAQNYKDGYEPIQTRDSIGRPYQSNSLKGARNIRFGPRRDMWLATRRHDFFSTRSRQFPFVTSTPASVNHHLRAGHSDSDFLKAGVGKKDRFEIQNKKQRFNTVQDGSQHELTDNHITANPNTPSMRTMDIPVVDRPKMTTVQSGFEAKSASTGSHQHAEQMDYTATMEEEKRLAPPRGDDYLATMDIGYGDIDSARVKNKKNGVQYVDGEDVYYEEEFEVDQFGEVGRGSDGTVIWPRRAIEEEELRREEETPISNLIVEEDREEGLIQTFRANTTKTTQDAEKVGKEAEAKDKKNVEVKSVPLTTTAKSYIEISTTAEKKTSTEPSTTVRNTVDKTTKSHMTTILKESIMKLTTDGKVKKSKSVPSTKTTLPPTTSPSTTTKTTQEATSSTTKTLSEIFPNTTGTKQTTLPYIWRETSAWGMDSVVTDNSNDKTSNQIQKSTDETTTKKTRNNKDVHLKDFLELQDTTEEMAQNKTMETDFSVTGKLTNESSLAQKAPEKQRAIFLDESLTKNLLGLQAEDIQEGTEAELTASAGTMTSSTSFLLLTTIIVLFH